jgi:hypothetical protein
VRPFETRSSASWTTCSEVESRAEVASSSRLVGESVSVLFIFSVIREMSWKEMTYSIFGSRIKARAIATLCFWPPDNMTPLEPTTVSRPAGREIYSHVRFVF